MNTPFIDSTCAPPCYASGERLLIVTSTSGLCNRLLTLAGSQRIAKATKRRLVLYWPCNGNLKCPFDELFDNQIEAVSDWHIYNLMHTQNRVTVYQTERKASTNGCHYRAVARQDDAQVIVVKGWIAPAFSDERAGDAEVLARPFLRELQPVERVHQKIDQQEWPQSSQVVGVHVRRGDAREKFEISRDEDFMAIMRDLMQIDPDIKFFLATDDRDTEARFSRCFPGRIFSQPKTSYGLESRRSVVGMQEAIIDLYLLARTRAVLGNHYSTFSKVAALLGNNRLIIANQANAGTGIARTLMNLSGRQGLSKEKH